MNFSEQIKHSNTDEWYTAEDSVKLIIPSLLGGGIEKYYVPLIRKTVTL